MLEDIKQQLFAFHIPLLLSLAFVVVHCHSPLCLSIHQAAQNQTTAYAFLFLSLDKTVPQRSTLSDADESFRHRSEYRIGPSFPYHIFAEAIKRRDNVPHDQVEVWSTLAESDTHRADQRSVM